MVQLENCNEKFNEEVQKHMVENRKNCSDLKVEYTKQQELYNKYADAYDHAMVKEEYNAPRFAANKVAELFKGHESQTRMLDYGCGSGLAADILINQHGFDGKLIDGLDPCQGLLDIAKQKDKMGKLYAMGSNDSHRCFPDKTYDVIFSSGVFFVSPTHAGFEVIPELIRMTKKGGFIIISTGDYYLQYNYVNFKIVEDLQQNGIIKIFPKELSENYRKPAEKSEGSTPIMGALLVYQVL